MDCIQTFNLTEDPKTDPQILEINIGNLIGVIKVKLYSERSKMRKTGRRFGGKWKKRGKERARGRGKVGLLPPLLRFHQLLHQDHHQHRHQVHQNQVHQEPPLAPAPDQHRTNPGPPTPGPPGTLPPVIPPAWAGWIPPHLWANPPPVLLPEHFPPGIYSPVPPGPAADPVPGANAGPLATTSKAEAIMKAKAAARECSRMSVDDWDELWWHLTPASSWY